MKHCKYYDDHTIYELLIDSMLDQLDNAEITAEEFASNFPMLVYADDTTKLYYRGSFSNTISFTNTIIPNVEYITEPDYFYDPVYILNSDSNVLYLSGCELLLIWEQSFFSLDIDNIPTPASVTVTNNGIDITSQVYTLVENEAVVDPINPIMHRTYRHRHTIIIPYNLKGDTIITYTLSND